jgi:hypothetical protein
MLVKVLWSGCVIEKDGAMAPKAGAVLMGRPAARSQFLLDFLELCPHAVASGFPLEEELAPAGLTADVDEPR